MGLYSLNVLVSNTMRYQRLYFQQFIPAVALQASQRQMLLQSNARETVLTSHQRSASFARDLAAGKLNMKWICPYPTLKTEDDLKELNQLSDTVAKFFSEKVDSTKMDREANFDPAVIEGLKDMGLFGTQIPEEYGGLGLSNVQYARVLEEVSTDGAITVMLAAHQAIGLKGILIAGNKEQKEKYLPRLATGEWIAAFCLTEPSSGSDAASIQTRATLSEDGKTWLLNGEKIWITNGGFADIMTVFAKTQVEEANGELKDKVTAFIVERTFGGVTSGNPEDKLGIRASNTCSVNFENTPVPAENVLGEVGGGFKIAMKILNSGRFSMGSSVAGQLKRMLATVTEHATTRTQFGRKLSEFGIIQDKIFDMTLKIYAAESMAYMTAGQMDILDENGDPPDCSIEAAMVKIYSSEAAWSCGSECLQILGGLGYMKDMPYERMLRDARILLIFEGTNEILRLYVALSMMQYAGAKLQQRLKLAKQGDGRERWTAIMDLFREYMRVESSTKFLPNRSFGLTAPHATKTWLHDSMVNSGKMIEANVDSFRKRVYLNLRKYGKKIQDEQLVLKTFADIAINIYAMSAVLGRCNKAKILSLRNCDHEKLIATAFIKKTYKENLVLLESLLDPYPFDCKEESKRVCDAIMEERRYLCSHPLEVVHRYQEHPKYLEHLERIKLLRE
ncbi:complex I assembly factor ACAD9, mitochondrial-like [Clavelina lepadiformis]|uniref:complex I assembly factor ACAD9, mitochondrial-like n=1 Tax=Clavelina lepadiformis TaxID=159417 RepID=UPI004041893A